MSPKDSLSWLFSWLPWASARCKPPRAPINKRGPRKATPGPFSAFTVNTNKTHSFTHQAWDSGFYYYAAEILQESIIETCSFARWLEPDCEPAILALAAIGPGPIYAHTNGGQWIKAGNRGSFKRCAANEVFGDFPEEIRESTECLRDLEVRHNTVTGTFNTMDKAMSAYFAELSKSVTKTWNVIDKDFNKAYTELTASIYGFSTKTSSKTRTGKSRSSSFDIAGNFRTGIDQAFAELDSVRKHIDRTRAAARTAANQATKKKSQKK